MPPKKDAGKEKKDETPGNNEQGEEELVEKELVIGFLRSKLGRWVHHDNLGLQRRSAGIYVDLGSDTTKVLVPEGTLE